MRKIGVWLWKTLSGGSTLYGFLPQSFVSTYLVPLLWTAVMIAAGILQGIQWMWVMVAATVAFTGSIMGMLYLSQWRDEQRVEGKIVLGQMRTGVKHGTADDRPEMILGITVNSQAKFPIEVNFRTIRTNIGDKIPSKRTFERTQFTVSPGGFAWFDDHLIVIDDPPKNAALEGRIEFAIDYGKPGNLKYTISGARRIYLFFDEDGKVKGGSWDESI